MLWECSSKQFDPPKKRLTKFPNFIWKSAPYRKILDPHLIVCHYPPPRCHFWPVCSKNDQEKSVEIFWVRWPSVWPWGDGGCGGGFWFLWGIGVEGKNGNQFNCWHLRPENSTPFDLFPFFLDGDSKKNYLGFFSNLYPGIINPSRSTEDTLKKEVCQIYVCLGIINFVCNSSIADNLENFLMISHQTFKLNNL